MEAEYEYWIDGNGREWHISELENSHLLNIFNMIKKRKEKTMQFVMIEEEMRKRKFLA
jgi:hypothetical protein